MTQTRRLGLPLLQPGQASKHVTVNDALCLLDTITCLAAESAAYGAPPSSAPVEDMIYLIGTPASGLWAGRAGQIARWEAGAWSFLVPEPGWRVWIKDSEELRVFTGPGGWKPAVRRIDNSPGIGVNTASSQQQRLAVASAESTFSHEGGSHRLTVNRADAAATASAVFKTDWIAHAEVGLCGSGNFSVRRSQDGLAWTTSFSVDRATGTMSVLGRVEISTPVDAISQSWSNGTHVGDMYLGLGGLWFGTRSVHPLYLMTGNSAARMTLTSSGLLGIGTTTPTCLLQVAGPVRVGSAPVASLPSPATTGAGAVLFVPDADGGPALAFSDGTAWRRLAAGAVIS